MATSLLPLLLQFLADSHDLLHTIAISPFATAILGLYKKDKKRAVPVTVEKKQFLTRLLDIVVSKMEYAADVDWSLGAEGEEDDDELTFAEMRKVRLPSLPLLERLERCADEGVLSRTSASWRIRSLGSTRNCTRPSRARSSSPPSTRTRLVAPPRRASPGNESSLRPTSFTASVGLSLSLYKLSPI